jgi:transketolase
MYHIMVLARKLDEKLFALQRSGKIGTFAQIKGQEGQVGTGFALEKNDWVVPSFREMGVFLARGADRSKLVEAWRGDVRAFQDPSHSRNLPVAIPIASQCLHAAGIAWASKIKGEKDFQADSYAGRNIRFGVREHGMGAVLNGMALHGGIIPYGATFLVFSDYMRPAIRLAALSHLHVIYVFTHDSIGLGEDGPTHQPVEHLAALRSIPGLVVIRPCDANETAEAWRVALGHKKGPVALALTRQAVPTHDRRLGNGDDGLQRGAYILHEADGQQPEVILISSGSEVQIALQAADRLQQENIPARVVSMPSWELFETQEDAYRQEVLPPGVRAKIAVEAGVSQGWHRYVGEHGRVISLEHFGASAPYQELYQNFGLTAEAVVTTAKAMLQS